MLDLTYSFMLWICRVLFPSSKRLANNFHDDRSEDPLGLGVNLLEWCSSALVKNGLGREALIFIVVVCVHAISELLNFVLAELFKDSLAGGTLIFSGEAIKIERLKYVRKSRPPRSQLIKASKVISWKSDGRLDSVFKDLLDDALVDKGRLLLGTTKHVDHVFHRHFLFMSFKKNNYYSLVPNLIYNFWIIHLSLLKNVVKQTKKFGASD